MNRLTRSLKNRELYSVDHQKVDIDENGYSGEAINRLGKFEDFWGDMERRQVEIPEEMAKLRGEGKEKSYRYKELMGEKLTVSHILRLLRANVL